MNFITEQDPDLDKIELDPRDFEENFEYNMNCFVRRTIFLHTIKTLREVRSKIVELRAKNL